MNDRPQFATGGLVYRRTDPDDDGIPAFLSPCLYALPHGSCPVCGYPLVRFVPGGVEHLISAADVADGDGERVWAEICAAHGGEESVDAGA